jgi:hypothetical protein
MSIGDRRAKHLPGRRDERVPRGRLAAERVLPKREHDIERQVGRRRERLDLPVDRGLIRTDERDAVERPPRGVLNSEHRPPGPRSGPVKSAAGVGDHDPVRSTTATRRERKGSDGAGNDQHAHPKGRHRAASTQA